MPATPKTYILFFVYILLGFSAFAQPLSISGRLIEQNSLSLTGKTRGLAGLSLLIDGKSVKTDPNGYFSLKINGKNRIGYIHLDSKEYQISKQEAVEQLLSCTQEKTIELQVEAGKTRTLSANFSQFYQQLRLQMGQTEIQWFKLFYAQQTDSLATLLGNSIPPAAIDRAFLRELFHNLEPMMEYWARRLARINLDHHAPDFKTTYQRLRAGQLKGLDQAIESLAARKDLRVTGIKDLLVSWYLARGKFQKAAEVLTMNREQEQPLPSTLMEFYQLGMLSRSFDAIMGSDEQLLNNACQEGNRFLAYSHLSILFSEQLDFAKAVTNYEAADLLWEQNLNKHHARYAPAYANMLINIGVLFYQQSNTLKAKELVNKAVEIYEGLSLESPALYEGDLMRAQSVLATFYLVYNNDYEQALRLLEPTLLLAQRLSRQNPQLYLSEVADLYLWKARCHQQLKDYDLAVNTYLLATNYYESQARQNPMELESVCNGYLLVAEAYSQQLNQSNAPVYKVKGLEVVQKGLQKARAWQRYDATGADMVLENLRYFEDIFSK